MQAVFGKMSEAVKAGYFRPGGAGTQFTAAQAQWSQAQEAILYPSGSWIENEMKSQTAADFQMTGAPPPSVTSGAAMPATAFHASAGEPFVVPSKGKNKAGGMEVLRIMLSKEAATNFAKTKLSSTVVKDTVPEDAFGSTALASQIAMLNAAGEDTYTFNFNDVYGFTSQNNVLWNGFLSASSTSPASPAACSSSRPDPRGLQHRQGQGVVSALPGTPTRVTGRGPPAPRRRRGSGGRSTGSASWSSSSGCRSRSTCCSSSTRSPRRRGTP